MNRFRRAAMRTFRSMSKRNYRLYFFGQIVSLSGTWMQGVAQAWLVLELTHSGPVATVTIDRPAKLNALTPELLESLENAVHRLSRSTARRRSAQRAFLASARVVHRWLTGCRLGTHRLVGQAGPMPVIDSPKRRWPWLLC